MEEFFETENGAFAKTFAVLRYHKIFDQYADAFQMEDVSAEVVQFIIRNNSLAELGSVIPTTGQRLRFVKTFQEFFLSTSQASSDPAPGANGRVPANDNLDSYRDETHDERQQKPSQKPEASPHEPSYPTTSPPPSGTFGVRSPVSMSPESQNTRPKHADPWKHITESLGLGVTSKFAIVRSVRTLALQKYKECVDETFLNPMTFVNDNEVEQIQDEAEDKAFTFLQEILSEVDSKSYENAEKALKEDLNKAARELRAKNEKQKESGKKELEDLAEDLCAKFTAAMRKEIGESFIDKFEFDSITQDIGNIYAMEFEKLCGASPLYDPEVFQRKLPNASLKLWNEIQGRNEVLQDSKKTIIEKATNIYKNLMEKATMTEELPDLHESSFLRGLKVITDSDLDHLKESAIEEYTSTIPSLTEDAKQRLDERIAKTDSEIDQLRETSIHAYNEKLGSIFSANKPVFEETVANKHNKAKREILDNALRIFENLQKYVPQPSNRKIQLLKEIEDILEQRNAVLVAENHDRWQRFETNANQGVENIKTFYKTEIEKLMMCKNQNDFEDQEQKLHEAVAKRFEQAVNKSVAKPDYLSSVEKSLKDFLKIEKHGIHQVFSLKQREDEVAVKSALLEAKRFYVAEMDNRFKAKTWYEEEELKKIHDEVLQDAIRACGNVIELSDRQTVMLNDAFLTVYKGYREDNICRSPNAEPAIGIDLGTTYCCVGVYFGGTVVVIPNVDYDAEKTTIASYVAFNDDGNIDVGHIAKENAYVNAQHTIFDAKRLIGRKFDDEVVQRDRSLWPFEVIGVDNEPRIIARGKTYRPEEISAKVLAKLKSMAEKFLNKTVKKAVITVPAYFSGSQRQATKDAANIAGFEETIIINEPTAAAVAYRLDSTGDLSKNVLVFDLGGGTFDVAVIQMRMGNINVLAIGGDTHLGGEDFDHNMVAEIIKRVKEKSGIDLSQGIDSDDLSEKLKASGRLRRLRYVCEQEKRKLSVRPVVTVRLENLHEDLPVLEEHITQQEFNNLNMELFEKCIECVESTLKDANLSKERINDVVLVGGSTRILKIQEMLKEYFRKQLINTLDVDTAVAIGAAYEAAVRFGGKSGRARSSAARGIKDVTPLSLGVAVYPDLMNVIIPKNSKIPCTIKEGGFSTLRDNQTSCEIRIFEGESGDVNDNVLLGKFVLNGVPPAPAGQEKMECTMTIDDEGILHVEAQILTNKKMGNLSIETYNGRMTKNEIKVAKEKPLLQWS